MEKDMAAAEGHIMERRSSLCTYLVVEAGSGSLYDFT